MNSSDHTTDSSQPLISLLGENYEYIKTIATNHIAIKKLQAIDVVGTVASRVVLFSILLILFFFLAIILIALAVLGLFNYFGSLLIALGATCGVLLFICFVVYIFRYQLIYNRILRALETIVTKSLS